MHAPARVHAVQYHYQRRERDQREKVKTRQKLSRIVDRRCHGSARSFTIPCARTLCGTCCVCVDIITNGQYRRRGPPGAGYTVPAPDRPARRDPPRPTRRRPTVLSLPAALKLYREMLHITLLAGLHSQDQTSTGPAWCTTIDQLPSSWRAKMLTQAILAFPGSIFSRHAQNANLPATEH